MKPVRTRFAPSPTGFLHVGGIRTALFAWLLARQNGGQFVLRLEDTDKKREVAGSGRAPHGELHARSAWTTTKVPTSAATFGPYRQSERLKDGAYNAWAQKLLDSRPRLRRPVHPGRIHRLSASKPKKIKSRFCTAITGPKIRQPTVGRQPTAAFQIRPQSLHVARRSHGRPQHRPGSHRRLHHLSNPTAIRPTTSRTSATTPTWTSRHIIRGQEFIASTPNYLNLYEALGLHAAGFRHHAAHPRLRTATKN